MIFVPEVPFDYDRLRDGVAERHEARGDVVVCVAEGVVDADGVPIAQDESNVDAFGHAKAGGAADVLARRLKADLGATLDTRNFNAVIPSYLYRSGSPIDVDREMGLQLGALAVDLILDDRLDHMACVRRVGDRLDVVGQPFEALERDDNGAIRPRRVDPRHGAAAFPICGPHRPR